MVWVDGPARASVRRPDLVRRLGHHRLGAPTPPAAARSAPRLARSRRRMGPGVAIETPHGFYGVAGPA
ncbi:MAG: hypothetical protein MZV63_16775 [Marinilabiliales bacterium]|nr:hypothetical protein [Marinilabiliales bacterium]